MDLLKNDFLYKVPLKRLDDLYPVETDIKTIKIDVENFEFEVLKGSKKLLERNMPVIYCELWDNENRVSVFELLGSMGYKAYIFNHQSESLDLISIKSKVSTCNFFFINF